jgi:hypothetical protein
MYPTTHIHLRVVVAHIAEDVEYIGNNLKSSKKWNIQGSWNGTIVWTN